MKFDIIAFGETKLKPTFPAGIYNLNGYERFNCCRDAKNCGGGLMVFVKKGILIKKFDKQSTTFEKIKMVININNVDYKLLIYYRNPVMQSLEPFLKDLEDELLENSKHTIIAGDINLDANSDNKDSEKYVTLLRSYDMSITNNIKTRNMSGRVIDHCCINFVDKTKVKNYTINTRLSDHNILMTELSCIKRDKEVKIIKIESTNWKKFNDTFVMLQSRSSIMDKTDPNEIAHQLTQTTKEAIKRATNHFNFKFSKDSKVCNWFNVRIMNAIKNKDRLIRLCKKKKGNVSLKNRLLQSSRRLKNIIKEEKDKFIRKSLQGSNIKKIWRNLNEILGRNTKSNDIIAVNDANGEMMYDSFSISERFNSYFIDSIEDLKRNLTKSLYPIKEKSLAKSMVLEDTTEEEMKEIIASLKNSAPGLDGIKAMHIKSIANEISPILVHLVNQMMRTGIYPKAFKTAIITPINKTGKKTEVSDYRPVSVLSTFNKIAEKIMYKRLTKFTDEYQKIIYKHQYGYRRKASTETAALEMINHVQMGLDKKMKVSLLFMDLKRAFDIVDINKLLLTLNNCGIRGQASNLIKDYLSDRQQVVKVNGVISSTRTFSQGVVQGSVLGSWLFLLFYNSIADLELNGKLFLFADDSVLINIHKTNEKVNEVICNDMKIIINFLNDKKLILNTEKTNFMILQQPGTRADETRKIEIESNDTDRIKIIGKYSISEARYLGLIIDENLKWESHIRNVESKISNATAILWKMRYTLPIDTKKMIYKSLIESHLSYMIAIWGSATDSSLRSLQVTQNRALRNVYDLDRLLSRTEMYLERVEANLPVRGLFFLSTAGFVFKVIKGLIYSNTKFERARAGSRNKSYLRPAVTRTVKASKAIMTIGPKIFNSLTDDVKKSFHWPGFRIAVRKFVQHEDIIQSCFNGDFLDKYS